MNSKISTEFALGIIMLLAFALGGLLVISEIEQTVPATNVSDQSRAE